MLDGFCYTAQLFRVAGGRHAAMAPPRKEAEQLVRLVATLGKVRVEPVQLKLL